MERNPLLLSVAVAAGTLITYYFWFGKSHQSRRKDLEKKLAQAQLTVRDLEEKLMSLEETDKDELVKAGKEVRIWMDGVFDMMHYGHMNAFRQGRALGTTLIAGVCSDETTTVCKGKPINSEAERKETVRACKWVDEVVEGVPYVMTDEYLNHVIQKYRIDYVVHGDDPCIVDGKDAYEFAVKRGMYLTIPRTEGVSTTDIVGRMLLMTRAHHEPSDALPAAEVAEQAVSHGAGDSVFCRKSNFLTTSRFIRLFGAGVKVPKKTDRIVYLAGSWDMFHAGHATLLEQARQYGDYVIVGVYGDAIVNRILGLNLPIMSLHERVLSVLGCKWVDDVLIDAPYAITTEMINTFNISVVLRGSISSAPPTSPLPPRRTPSASALADESVVADDSWTPPDPYAVASTLGILQTVESRCPLTVHDIVHRVQEQHEAMAKKFAKKHAQELDFYAKKYGQTPML